MPPSHPDRATVLRYVALQLPSIGFLTIAGAGAHEFLGWEPRWIAAGIALWIVKDAAMFPFVWRAYHPGTGEETRPVVGRDGIAQERLSAGGEGYVRVGSELWRARTTRDAAEGETVRVVERDGLTLVVDPRGPRDASDDNA